MLLDVTSVWNVLDLVLARQRVKDVDMMSQVLNLYELMRMTDVVFFQI